MKKFILKTTVMTLPVALALVLTNYIGDSAKLFNTEYERDIAEIIVKGKNVTNIQNFDERLLQQHLIGQLKKTPKTVVIGSSRTMLISSANLENSSLVNNSVSGASIEDLVSIYQLYKDKGELPEKIILGIDPWTFNANSGHTRWQSIAEAYNRFHKLRQDDNSNGELSKLKQLISLTYFQSSVGSLPKVVSGNDKPVATDNKYNQGNTRLTDGSLIYGEKTREVSKEKVDELVKDFIIGEIYGLKDFKHISEKNWNDFEKLISDMKANGVEVELFLAPYHPDVYAKIQKEYAVVVESENLIKNYAAINNIMVYGSFDPVKSKVTKLHFYDGMHCDEEGIKLVLNNGHKLPPSPAVVLE